MVCKFCNSTHVHKDGNHNGFQRYKCQDCLKRFDGEKYAQNDIIHFHTKLKKTDRNYLTRENYCVPTNEIDYKEKRNIQLAKELTQKNGRPPLLCPPCYCDIPNKYFKDEEHYTDEYVKTHYAECMENFDLNMQYFAKLDFDKFNKYLLNFVKRNKFVEIIDLADVANKIGAYILVLDKYKQVYIGISKSDKGVKGRIIQHWSAKKPFGRLLYGKVDTSILSIDSFGALDTTRIYFKELKWYQDLDKYEEQIVNKFKPEYRLNRVAGGINSEEEGMIRNLRLNASMQNRQL